MQYKVFDEPITLIVKTKRPEKWLLVDRETGTAYQGSPQGHWDRLDPYIKSIDDTPQIQYTKYMREPKIMKMDWRSLGYWPVYKDGKLTWEKDPDDGE